MTPRENLIRVHCTWSGWQNAEVRLRDIRDVHWFRPDRAPHAFLHGFVSCRDIVNGQIPHHCDGASAPHTLRVCLLKRHVIASAYAELVRCADASSSVNRQSVALAASVRSSAGTL